MLFLTSYFLLKFLGFILGVDNSLVKVTVLYTCIYLVRQVLSYQSYLILLIV